MHYISPFLLKSFAPKEKKKGKRNMPKRPLESDEPSGKRRKCKEEETQKVTHVLEQKETNVLEQETRESEQKEPHIEPSEAVLPTKKWGKPKFVYGNYSKYYGYRLDYKDKSLLNDPRLNVFDQSWFQNRKCLDIGCNVGFITIAIAERFHIRRITGVDLDVNLINQAKNFLHKRTLAIGIEQSSANHNALKMNDTQDESQKLSTFDFPISFALCYGPLNRSSASEGKNADSEGKNLKDGDDRENGGKGKVSSLQQVKFKTEDVMKRYLNQNDVQNGSSEEKERQKKDKSSKKNAFSGSNRYHTILCLSTTKWLHLHHGDEGLKWFFLQVFQILKPGGHFILEPQPWKSYKKKYNISEHTKRVFHTIEFRPNQFSSFLEEIGFSLVQCLQPEKKQKGFDRPMWVYTKPRVES